MLLSSRLSAAPPFLSPSMTYYDHSNNNIDRRQQIGTSTLIPSTSLPKYFNVPFAVQHGYFRCIRYLLQLHYDPNERDNQLRTPLILCAYVENDRWSLSIAQNLLEKGAKVALEDHARRNAMHHACALQRTHLVQLYLSCLDFNIEAKDCEGNTCLHYAAITGNCEIAELLIRSAEKVGIRLDQYVNREGCSAAVLALKYGHIECANQITHRDWDEFFVVPRPLSIYEVPQISDEIQPTITKNKTKTNSPRNKNETRPSTLSFGLLKIIFNDCDTSYSTRLADLCKQDKHIRQRQHSKYKRHEALNVSTTIINKLDRTKSTIVNGNHYNSTEALVNEIQSSNITKECQTSFDSNSHRVSPRIQLLMQQNPYQKSNSTFGETQISNEDFNKTKSILSKTDHDETKSKISIQTSNLTLNPTDNKSKKIQRSTTAITRDSTLVKPSVARLTSVKIKSTPITSIKTKKKSTNINQTDSIPTTTKQVQSTVGTDSSTFSHDVFEGRPISSVINHSSSRSSDQICSIREAKGKSNRFNKPEKLFGIRPEELFAPEEHQPKIVEQRISTKQDENNTHLAHSQTQKEKQKHIWQQDIDKIIELYNIHHSTNYRKSAALPTQTSTDTSHASRSRRMSVSKNLSTTSKQVSNPKQSTYATLNISRRNSISRPSIKLTNS